MTSIALELHEFSNIIKTMFRAYTFTNFFIHNKYYIISYTIQHNSKIAIAIKSTDISLII